MAATISVSWSGGRFGYPSHEVAREDKCEIATLPSGAQVAKLPSGAYAARFPGHFSQRLGDWVGIMQATAARLLKEVAPRCNKKDDNI